jgi:hypothetical protein
MTIGLALACFFASALSAQRTWIVDVFGGPGSQFTDIQSAVDAATAGDVVLIRPGASSFNVGFTVSKGITIMPERRAWGVSITTDIIVRGIPAGERLMLKRLGGFNSASIRIENNAGTVVVEKCQPSLQGGQVFIRNSRSVILNEGGALGIRVDSSFVTINRGLNSTGLAADPALWVSRAIVVFGNSILVGSRANYDGIRCVVVFPPGDAISGHDSVLHLGAGTTLRAGTLAISGGPCPPIFLQAATINGQNITVIRDPATTLVGPVQGSVTVTTQPYPTLDGIVADEVHGRMDFDLIGAPGAPTALMASLPADPVLTPFGIQWTNLHAYLVAGAGMVDATGHWRTSMTLPLAYPLGQPMVFQSIVLDPQGLFWSTPSVIIRN